DRDGGGCNVGAEHAAFDSTRALTAVPPLPTERVLRAWGITELGARMAAGGHPHVAPAWDGPADSGVVLYPVDVNAIRGFRRRSRAIFVIGIGEADDAPS